jgi:hypothetical protein
VLSVNRVPSLVRVTELPESLPRFYGTLLRRVPKSLETASERVLNAMGFVVVLVVLFNQSLAERISSWDGISPWWALAPIAALVARSLLVANYENHRLEASDLASARKELERLGHRLAARERDQAFADVLTERRQLGIDILNRPMNSPQLLSAWTYSSAAWRENVLTLLREHSCTKQEIASFEWLGNVTTGGYDADPSINHEKSVHAEAVRRLERIINNYSVTPIFA